MVKIKGNEIEAPKITASFDRKAVQIQNNIIQTLRPLGVDRDHVNMKLEKLAQRKAPASVSWYFQGRNLKYSYSMMKNFVENLYIIDKVLKCEVEKLLSQEITASQFVSEFSEDDNLSEQLQEARKTLGVSENETDFEVITKQYKDLARTHHPDMPNGDHSAFQRINTAHKLLKKQLT
jgi:hypothetical protein